MGFGEGEIVRCPRCKRKTKRIDGEDKEFAGVPHYQRRHECQSCTVDGEPYRFTTDERPMTPAGGGEVRNSLAEAQVSSLPNGGKCFTIMLPPDASPESR